MIAISFLGTGNYNEANYYDHTPSNSCKNKFFQIALCKLFEPEKVFIFQTEEAKEKHHDALNPELLKLKDEKSIDYEFVDIPSMKNENEIWQLFNIISDKISENSEVLIDITHAFRSIPILVLSVANYLSVAKKIKVSDIVYGAFEARDDNGTPIIHLRSFLDLMDWSSSVSYMLKFAETDGLIKKLDALRRDYAIQHKTYLDRPVSNIIGGLKEVNGSLKLIRSSDIPEASKKLVSSIGEFYKQSAQLPDKFIPLSQLFNQINSRFKLLMNAENQIEFSPDYVENIIYTIDLYLETFQFVQCTIYCKESLLSKFCFDNNFDRLREERKSTALIKLYKDRREDMEFSENLIKYIQISDQLNDLRNDLAHAGYRIGPRQFDNAINSIINLASEVKIMLKGDSLKLTPDQLELVRDILE